MGCWFHATRNFHVKKLDQQINRRPPNQIRPFNLLMEHASAVLVGRRATNETDLTLSDHGPHGLARSELSRDTQLGTRGSKLLEERKYVASVVLSLDQDTVDSRVVSVTSS